MSGKWDILRSNMTFDEWRLGGGSPKLTMSVSGPAAARGFA
jgi:hypothetical protein